MLHFGAAEIGLLALIMLLCFGPKQLPKLARSLGESIRELRGVREETRDALRELDR